MQGIVCGCIRTMAVSIALCGAVSLTGCGSGGSFPSGVLGIGGGSQTFYFGTLHASPSNAVNFNGSTTDIPASSIASYGVSGGSLGVGAGSSQAAIGVSIHDTSITVGKTYTLSTAPGSQASLFVTEPNNSAAPYKNWAASSGTLVIDAVFATDGSSGRRTYPTFHVTNAQMVASAIVYAPAGQRATGTFVLDITVTHP